MTGQYSERFPGPRPYEEHQHHLFFGREREVERMINATRERLGVLSADSGAGKSSLLAAGYIPELRRRRAFNGAEPPVLLLRSWGGRASKPEDRILAGIREAVNELPGRAAKWDSLGDAYGESDETRKGRAKRIAERIREDHQRLSEVLERPEFKAKTAPLKDVVQALSDTDGLILILDQFEEFMGSASAEEGGDHRPAERVTQAVGRLFRDVQKIKIFIALRTEYCRTLQRYLNSFVVNLDRRIIDLSPLPPASIVQVVKGVSGQNTAKIEDFARKLAQASGATDEGSTVSVLEVQALLYGYDVWCKQEKNQPDFTTELWDQYVEKLTQQQELGGSTAAMPGRASRASDSEVGPGHTALKQWVDGQLDRAVSDSGSDDGQRARWMLVPVLPRLSTQGGYKQHLPLMALCLDLADRVCEGWGKLRTVETSVETWLKDGGDLKLELAAADLKDLKERGATLWDKRQTSVERTKVLEETRNRIVDCIVAFKTTIMSLRDKQILKLSGDGRDESCELVHDGLSEHVRRWSEDLPRNPATVLGSPVEVIGERFIWRALGNRERATNLTIISKKKWTGCSLKGATITNVKFEDCILPGLSLKGCILENVVFERCIMPGAVLLDCDLESVQFNNCTMTSTGFLWCDFAEENTFTGSLHALLQEAGAEVTGDMTGIEFENCTLQIGSKMKFNECVLRFARISKITNRGGNRWEFDKCDLMNAWVEDAGTPAVGVDQHCRTIGLLSFELPPVGWLERKKQL